VKTVAIALLLLVVAFVFQPAPALRASGSDGDPSTLIPLNQLAKWTKDFPATNWDVLSDFDYIFPPPGGKLSARKLVVPAAVQKLNGQKVSIKGYMIPIEMDGQGVAKFALTEELNTCCFALPAVPNQWIIVTMPKKTSFIRWDPITVFGTLHVGEIAMGDHRENIESFYQMDGNVIAIHPGE
jgi:hypothetical protein